MFSISIATTSARFAVAEYIDECTEAMLEAKAMLEAEAELEEAIIDALDFCKSNERYADIYTVCELENALDFLMCVANDCKCANLSMFDEVCEYVSNNHVADAINAVREAEEQLAHMYGFRPRW